MSAPLNGNLTPYNQINPAYGKHQQNRAVSTVKQTQIDFIYDSARKRSVAMSLPVFKFHNVFMDEENQANLSHSLMQYELRRTVCTVVAKGEATATQYNYPNSMAYLLT